MTRSLNGATVPLFPLAMRTRTLHGLVTSTTVALVLRCWISAPTSSDGGEYVTHGPSVEETDVAVGTGLEAAVDDAAPAAIVVPHAARRQAAMTANTRLTRHIQPRGGRVPQVEPFRAFGRHICCAPLLVRPRSSHRRVR